VAAPVSATWVTFLFEAANFLLLAAVLGWLFFRPVRDALERRRSQIEEEQSAAAGARAEAERALREARARRAELEGSLAELRQRAEREAEKERERLVDAARAEAQRERDTLKADLLSLRRAQAHALARDAAFASREILVRLLAQLGGPDLEAALLEAACRQLEKLRSSGPLAPIVIESARPLDAAALASLAEAAGVSAADANHRDDPELVAGVRVLTARGLVDVSAKGLAAQVESLLVGQLDRESAEHD
jgi:F-type H+-transporting ATPase subunit b